MMLMMLAKGARIISIIGARFSNLRSSGTPLNPQKMVPGPRPMLMMQILGVLGDTKNPSKILSYRGDSLLERM